MKLFAKTAVLCVIPKVVNHVEDYIVKLITPAKEPEKAPDKVPELPSIPPTFSDIDKGLNKLVKTEEIIVSALDRPVEKKRIITHDTHKFSPQELRFIKGFYKKAMAVLDDDGKRVYTQAAIISMLNKELDRTKRVSSYMRIINGNLPAKYNKKSDKT